MSTTITAFVASVVNTLSVSGVKHKFAYPPTSLDTAQLPASFPTGFRNAQTPMTFGTHGGWPTFEIDFFIAVEAVAQSTQPTNYALMLTLADALDAALHAVAPNAIGKGPVTWTIAGGNQQIEVAGIMYWAVMATIQGRG